MSDFSLDISFTTDSGITILSGASGAGKTSVLRLIAGILTPDEGIIKVGSQTYFDSNHKINLPIQERKVGFVFQDYLLFPHLNAGQNIAYGIKGEIQKNKSEKVSEMLALLRIDHLRKRLPQAMSGGEQQRVALARALASAPQIVLLDEPLSAVDVEMRANLLDVIESAQRRVNVPFIYITHNQAEAERLGSRKIVLENGRVVR